MRIAVSLISFSLVSLVSIYQARADLAWGAAFNFTPTDQSVWQNDFNSSLNGGVSAVGPVTVFEAISYGDATGLTPTINGIAFTELGGATDFWGNTGIDPNIDEVLSGHVTDGGSTFSRTLTGLTVGNVYQVQLIGIHDNRAGIRDREYEVAFAPGDYTSGGTAPVLTRGAYGNGEFASPGFGTVVGSFTATATTETIELRSNTLDGNFGDDPDPGLSGYIVLESTAAVPEPSSFALFGATLVGIAFLRRRKS